MFLRLREQIRQRRLGQLERDPVVVPGERVSHAQDRGVQLSSELVGRDGAFSQKDRELCPRERQGLHGDGECGVLESRRVHGASVRFASETGLEPAPKGFVWDGLLSALAVRACPEPAGSRVRAPG